MKRTTLHIDNPSKDLLTFVRELKQQKDLKKAAFLKTKAPSSTK